MSVEPLFTGDEGYVPDRGAQRRGAVLRERREALGISLRAFARQCDLSPAHVSKVERGLASPSLATLARIVDELGLEPSLLFAPDDAPATAAVRAPQVVRRDEVLGMAGEGGSPEGSVVRVLARPEHGMVIEGIGGPDYFLAPTIAPREAVLCVLAGSVEVAVEHDRFSLGAGESIVIPALARHSVRVTGGVGTHTIYLSPHGSRMLHDEPPPAERRVQRT